MTMACQRWEEGLPHNWQCCNFQQVPAPVPQCRDKVSDTWDACIRQASLKRGTTGRTELSAAETSVVGALAGAVTGLVTTPLDVIKTRLMTQGVSRKYDGIFDCARKIAQQEGTATFFKVSMLQLTQSQSACEVGLVKQRRRRKQETATCSFALFLMVAWRRLMLQ